MLTINGRSSNIRGCVYREAVHIALKQVWDLLSFIMKLRIIHILYMISKYI